MTAETFVDTSGFYALLVRRDQMHVRAKAILGRASRIKGQFVTSDYVLDETATLLKARRYSHLVDPFFEIVFSSSAVRVEWMGPDWFQETRVLLRKHQDQEWSFTDCSSFVIMNALALHDALTKDKHFRHAGFNPLLI